MAGRIAFLNGKLVPESQATKISAFDHGFVFSDQVIETTRTFNHKPFKLEEHLQRLYRSIRATKMPVSLSLDEMRQATTQVLEANIPLLRPEEEYFILHWVTAGGSPPYVAVPFRSEPATVLIFCEPMHAERWAKFYIKGAHVITLSVRHTPAQVLDPKIKNRNRLHFVLGDLEVKERDPEAISVFLDMQGNLTEGSATNFFIVSEGVLCTPDDSNILQGISRSVVIDLAKTLGVSVKEEAIQPYDAINASEAFLSGTNFAILPVVKFNGVQVGDGKPGPLTKQLLAAWQELVGMDFVQQALDQLPQTERASMGV